MARVTGVGGVVLKSADPKALGAWYAKHLGVAWIEDCDGHRGALRAADDLRQHRRLQTSLWLHA